MLLLLGEVNEKFACDLKYIEVLCMDGVSGNFFIVECIINTYMLNV